MAELRTDESNGVPLILTTSHDNEVSGIMLVRYNDKATPQEIENSKSRLISRVRKEKIGQILEE